MYPNDLNIYLNVSKIINIQHYANDNEFSKSFHFACELTVYTQKYLAFC